MSVQLLHIIAHKADLKQSCGDITNDFVTAFINKKVYCVTGLEFGEEYKGKTIIIKRDLYGLASSAERFYSHLANTLRSFEFEPTRNDNDVGMRLDDSELCYKYVCTHVGDSMIVSKNPDKIMKEIETLFKVKEDSKGPPDYYLGNDYKRNIWKRL